MTRGPQFRSSLPASLDAAPRRTRLPPEARARVRAETRSGAVIRLVCPPLMMGLAWWLVLRASWPSPAGAWIVYGILGVATLFGLVQTLFAAGDLLWCMRSGPVADRAGRDPGAPRDQLAPHPGTTPTRDPRKPSA